MCKSASFKNDGIAHQQSINGSVKSHDPPRNNPPSAMRRLLPLIISGYILNTIVYFAVYALLPTTLANGNGPSGDDDDGEPCSRPDLLAFQVVSLLNLSFLGLLGFYTWFVSKRARKALPQTPQGRYFGNKLNKGVLLPEADYVNAVIVVFQGWDFIASMFFEEHCTMIMMVRSVHNILLTVPFSIVLLSANSD